jgi:NAD-dependent deacetylase
MKIVAFTGAGISVESGVDSYRDKSGIWKKYNVKDYATPAGWKRDRELVLNFYNGMREKCKEVKPNDAHKYLARLEEQHEVTIITQNVDDLHEKAGSTNILHLHGELNKNQSSMNPKLVYENCTEPILIGDKCEKGSQLRPHVVWFGEMPNNVEESYQALQNCDLLLIIGSSLEITYTIEMLGSIDDELTAVIYIDPNPSDYMEGIVPVEYIKEKATVGMKKVYEGLV